VKDKRDLLLRGREKIVELGIELERRNLKGHGWFVSKDGVAI
jgi:hypothetical protein